MHLVSLAQPREAASVKELSQSLEYEHEVKREVTLQVMRWFGEVDAESESWDVDVERVVRQVGLGILRQHKVVFASFFHARVSGVLISVTPLLFAPSLQNDPVPEDEFMDKWNTAVGDTFATSTSLQLLKVSAAFFLSPLIRSFIHSTTCPHITRETTFVPRHHSALPRCCPTSLVRNFQ